MLEVVSGDLDPVVLAIDPDSLMVTRETYTRLDAAGRRWLKSGSPTIGPLTASRCRLPRSAASGASRVKRRVTDIQVNTPLDPLAVQTIRLLTRRVLISCGETVRRSLCRRAHARAARSGPASTSSAWADRFAAAGGRAPSRIIADWRATGLTEPIARIRSLRAARRPSGQRGRDPARRDRVPIDFWGFNYRLRATLRGGIPVVYYISPQLWATSPGAAKTDARSGEAWCW